MEETRATFPFGWAQTRRRCARVFSVYTIIAYTLFALPTLADSSPAKPPSSFVLPEIFSAEKSPGQGTLTYTLPNSPTETISIGSGSYAMGVVFPSDTLPDELKKDFKNKEVLQVLLGPSVANTGANPTPFGNLTLILASKGPRSRRAIPLQIPVPQETPLPDTGYLIFSSPRMPAQVSDEEKLRKTFFAKRGSVSLSASTATKPLSVAINGKNVTFRVQGMRLEVQADLSTPFNNEERQLNGKFEFPLYYPEGQGAKKLIRQLAESSFQSKLSLHLPDEKGSRRQISSQPSPAPKR
jgi:hypothetical protein